MINDLVSAFVLGLIGGSIPGPILTAIFTEILQSGLAKSFRIVFLGMLTETIVASICLIALSSLHLPESIFRIISLLGAIILVWLSTSIWKIKKIDTKQRVHFSTWKIVAMILANGGLWIFWITVCVPRAILLSHKVSFGAFLFLLFVEVGWLFSTAGIAFIFSRFREWLSKPHIVPVIFKIFALAFIYFATVSIYQSIVFFLRK
ncbi:hypothetical protein HY029_03110 [Candidatus Gottesmanbacteria bacterium]|nr:hypothetical protein [Candidatus Gottesmanbacteria bacterium]